MAQAGSISVCIATYRRPDRLARVLHDLARQALLPAEVVVVDNDASGSAADVVREFLSSGPPFPVHYDSQLVKNISLTRNRTVAIASGEWLAFIDDDERAPAAWLQQLTAARDAYSADGVLGPVIPLVPADAPAWIRRGNFYDFPRMPTGSVVPPNRLRFGNILLHGPMLRQLGAPFDPAYGSTGGEDGDLLSRLALQGAKLVWCDHAIVEEPIEASRLSLKWLLRRSLRGGQDYARHLLCGRYGVRQAGRLRLLLRALLQLLVAGSLAVLALPFGRHHAVRWLTRASANLGKLSVFFGWHYREYA